MVLTTALVLTSLTLLPALPTQAVAAGSGNILIVMAHPDDEALATAGIIAKARNAGRRVYVALVTNGDSRAGSGGGSYCGTTSAQQSAMAQFGVLRNTETLAAMTMLGLTRSLNTAVSDIFFLGYPDGGLLDVAGSGSTWTGDPTGLHRTYADDGDGSTSTCNGDLRYLLSGRHSSLTAAELAADFEALVTLTNPTDIYTHATFDGHVDHVEVHRQTVAAAQRKGVTATVHSALVHPEGTGSCDALSAYQWPNPSTTNNDPFARFTPTIDVTAPPVPTCSTSPNSTSWGSAGPPDELVEVPADMQSTDEATNRKWQIISKYASQIDCKAGGTYPASCGYMRAFVKKHEFFWTSVVTPPTPPPPGSNRFGVTTVGPLLDKPAAEYKFGSIHALSEPATLLTFSFHARGGPATQKFIPVVYAVGANDKLGSLLVKGEEVTVTANSVASWRASALPATSVPAGRYMLALLAGPSTAGAILHYNSVVNGGTYNANSYPTPSSDWGSTTSQDSQHSFYVDYQPSVQDTQAPSVSVTAPSGGSAVSGTTTVSADATDNVGVARVEFLVDGAVAGTDTTSPHSFAWDTNTVSDGPHNLSAKAYDPAGNVGTSAVVAVMVNNLAPSPDTQSPTVSMTAPANGATVSATATMTAGASDNVGITRVDFLVDGTVVGNDSTSPYSFAWDTTTATNGSHGLAAKAYDAAGNAGTSATITVTVANVAARTFGVTTVGTSTDQPGANFRFGSPYTLYEPAELRFFRFYARGGGSPQKFIPVLYNVDATGTPTNLVAQGAEVTVSGNAVDAWQTSALPATTLPAGRYVLGLLAGTSSAGTVLYFTSEPNGGMYAGNAYPTPAPTWGPANSVNARYSFYVEYQPGAADTQSPAVSLTAPANGATVSATSTVSADATDNVAVTRVEFLVDGSVVGSVAASPYTFAWDTATVPNGSHALAARAYDVAGNSATSATVNVTVNNVALKRFGAATPGSSTDPPTANYRFGSIYTLPETAVLGNFKFYARGGSSNQKFVPAIYNVDVNGSPTNLVAQGPEVTVAAQAPVGWQSVSMPAATLAAGRYLLALLAGPKSGSAAIYFTPETGASRWASNTYPTPASTWGPVNLGNARYSFYVDYKPPAPDTQNPTTSIVSPADGATVSSRVDVAATATDNVGVSKIDVLLDGSVLGSISTAPYTYSWDTHSTVNGPHTLVARAYDEAGNTGTSQTVNVTVGNVAPPPDTSSPTSAISAPAAGATLTGTTTVSASASDNTAVTKVEFLVDGSLVDTDATGPYSYSWDTTTVANGSHTLLAKAYDEAGNTGTSSPVTITVNNVAARSFGAAAGGPLGDQPGSGYRFGSIFQLFEPAVLTSFGFYAQGGSASQSFVPALYNVDTSGLPTSLVAQGREVTVPANATIGWQTASLPPATVYPGSYVLALVSGPNSGGAVLFYSSETGGGMYNTNAYPTPASTWGSFNVVNARYSFQIVYQPAAADSQDPVVAITAPANGATVSDTVTVAATASDNAAVTKVEFSIDGVVRGTDTTSPYTYSWDSATVPNGSHALVARAHDIAGNVGLSSTTTVTVSNIPDTQSPTVSITSPSNGATVSNITTITATAADNVRVTRVEFYIDGLLKSTVLAAPYTYAWDTSTATTGTHNLVAKAYDSPGNVGTSSTVTVNNITAGPAVSDDFSGPLDASRWTFVNPLGDSSASVNGTQAVISVAAGPAHYVWTGGAQAPRLMQTVANGDFEVEAKFQSTLSAKTQIQGILIEQDANNFVRFDVSGEGCLTQVAGATVGSTSGTGWFVRDVSGGADVYMRVKRVGNDWTLSYSYDGRAWTTSGTFTRPLNVSRVGPFAGNSGPDGGSAPAFTAKVDYFVNRAAPLSTEDGSPFVPPAAGPVIDVWYGDNQTFGQRGRPQQWVNVLGRVTDPDGISSLTYTLNGGAEQILSMGENAVRLVAPGDFNVELAYSSLIAGANTVRIRAVDRLGTTTLRTVTVNYVAGVTAPANYSVDWSTASSINSAAQISDGLWRVNPDGTVRPAELGYDRLIELGDMSWTNYEVSADVTIWDMPCGGAAVGLVAGWTGHTTDQYGVPAADQPRVGHPFPVFGSYLVAPNQAPRLSIGANTAAHQEAELIGDFSGRQLTLGVPYVFKLRTQTNATGGSRFSFKVWRVGTSEPTTWDLQVDGDRSQGAVVLAAHGGDVSFGRVTVTGL